MIVTRSGNTTTPKGTVMDLSPSAHLDTFARDHLPAPETWPTLEFVRPDLEYPARLNAAVALLDETIAHFGEHRVAFHTPEDETPGTFAPGAWSYGDVRRHVNQLAHVLVDEYGVVPGNRVLLRLPNSIWAAVTWLAVLKAGAVVVTTMVAWRQTELGAVVRRVRPTLAVVDHRFLEGCSGVFDDEVAVAVLGGDSDFRQTAALKSQVFEAVDTAADDVALFGPTSGTTGEPKITMHFHRDILANADTFGRHVVGLTETDVSACSAPFAFTFGLGALLVFPLRSGGSSLLLEKPSPVGLADAIASYNISVLYTAPTGYRTILKQGRADTLRGLRMAVSAGEHLPIETFRAVEEASGVRLVNGIGSTEMLHVFVSASGDDIVPGATGIAIPGYRATVLDEKGVEVVPGTLGRLAVIGPTGCRYLDGDRQSIYVQNGWNVTGDTYIQDDAGYFHYQARSDDMIVASGYNIGAPEVEAVIDAHPDVIESAVIGRPDPTKGAIVSAFVVLRPGVAGDDTKREELMAAVLATLAPFKAPRRIDFVDTLPRNSSGKLQRYPLRDRATREAADLLDAPDIAQPLSTDGATS